MKAEQERSAKASGKRAARPETETYQDSTASEPKGERLGREMMERQPDGPPVRVAVKPLDFRTIEFAIVGDSPYVQNKFSAKATAQIVATQKAGSVAQSKRERKPKDFDALYEAAMHIAKEGWHGMPAPAFRNAMISACRTCGVKMTHAKLGVFIIADGYDPDGTPLVKITRGKPRMHVGPARNDNGSVDIRARPMWDPGWEAKVTVRYDADMFSMTDVTNLMVRVGAQVGIGEGRPDSKDSAGVGWGTFEVR